MKYEKPEEFDIESATWDWSGMAWGPMSGKPVLALHGWLDNAASFSGLGPLLAEKGYRVFAVDLPGHGGTPSRDDPYGYHFVDSVTAVAELMDSLELKTVRLLGHSMGAGIASLYAGTFPERISHLALIEGLGPFSGVESEAPARLRKHVDAVMALMEKTPPVYTAKDIPGLVKKRAAVGPLSEAGAAELIERALTPIEDGPRGALTWRTDVRLKLPSAQRMTEAEILAFLKAIKAPTLLVLGEKGMAFEPALAKGRQDVIKNLQLHRLPGGHHLHLDDPGPVSDLLARFLA
ncbi:MAG TPA: alpha/beta hydrolase [Bdellovibrionota bacterium]|jgi:pimeloyl-ACP methyl ester carboxylesterase|nr:alpha/beta hydrolase [Bdellovibrionota bacterium]